MIPPHHWMQIVQDTINIGYLISKIQLTRTRTFRFAINHPQSLIIFLNRSKKVCVVYFFVFETNKSIENFSSQTLSHIVRVSAFVKIQRTMKVSILSIVAFFSLPLMSHAAGESFQTDSAYGNWRFHLEDSCTRGSAWFSAMEGTTIDKDQGKPSVASYQWLYFDYSLYNTCTLTSTYGHAYADSANDITIDLKKTTAEATVSMDLQGIKMTWINGGF